MSGRIYQQFVQSSIGYFIISAVSLLYLSWPPVHASFLSLFAFVPVLFMVDKLLAEKKSTFKITLNIYIILALWNITTTWWIYNATAAGAIFALLVNALLMLVPFIFFIILYKKGNTILSYIAFVSFYLAFEYWHLNWDLSWPWLTLGNCFAKMPYLVQWYEYTGVLGGSLWILVSSVLIFHALKNYSKKTISYAAAIIVLPCIVSFGLYYTYAFNGKLVKVVVVQPNIDPYTEKFAGSPNHISDEKQMERLVQLTKQGLRKETRPSVASAIVLWPETALPIYVDENIIQHQKLLLSLDSFARKENIMLVTGIDSYKFYGEEKGSITAKLSEFDNTNYYDTYNAAIALNGTPAHHVYHKSKLVPGVESLPYPEIFGGLTSNLGGIVSTLGYDTCTTTYFNADSVGVSPVICYESIFGDYVREFVLQGSDIIGIITNDGWWGNTPGHIQHWHYARLRAVENRKPVARAANTGISGFINARGDIMEETKYWTPDVRSALLPINNTTTFYTRHGDYIGWMSCIVSLIVLAIGLMIKK
ncbi:MAG: apolipoprotein N-acyltransferase [Cytophagaceae bacterium]